MAESTYVLSLLPVAKHGHSTSRYTGYVRKYNCTIVFFCIVIRFSLINKKQDTKYVYTDLTDLER